MVLAALSFPPGSAAASDYLHRTAVGYEIDLLPTALSAAAGESGYAFQTWAGIDHLKIRLIGAHISLPDKLIGNDSFQNREMNVGAVIIDYVFGENFEGFWLGTGIELWQNSIEHKTGGERTDWTTGVLTIGGGYIFKIYDNFFLNPWGALHYVMNEQEILVSGDRYKENPVQYSFSIKAGYYFSI